MKLVPVKTITVSVDDETYRLSSVKAVEAGTSIAALVRSFLVELTRGGTPERRFDQLQQLQEETLAAIHARNASLSSADNLGRDELHDRNALR